MCTHNVCFEQKYPKMSTENFQFLQLKNLFIAWACFRNARIEIPLCGKLTISVTSCSHIGVSQTGLTICSLIDFICWLFPVSWLFLDN